MTLQEYERELDRQKRPFLYCIWKGCDSALASKIACFSAVRTARLAKNPRWDPRTELAATIDTGWSEYVRSLRIPVFDKQFEELVQIDARTGLDSKKRLLAAETSLSRARSAIEDRALEIFTEMAKDVASREAESDPDSAYAGAVAECEWVSAYEELLASLNSIISILGICGHPPAGYEIDSDEVHIPFCDFPSGGEGGSCNKPTEFEEYRQGDTLDDEKWKVLRRLSVCRCMLHRNVPLTPAQSLLADIDLRETDKSTRHNGPTGKNSARGMFSDNSDERHRKTCRLCPRRTELWSLMRSGSSFSTSVSSEFCRHHRPRQQDGSWRRGRRPGLERSTYESRVAKVSVYQREFARLDAHVMFGDVGTRTSSNLALDLFARNVVARLQLCDDEKFELARVAWHLVEHDVTDRKKEIVIRVASRHTQASIAKDLGMSRQAVHANLKSVPRCFRFDCPIGD